MANKNESKILNALLDSFEKSKTFIGENKNQQTFKISVSKLFAKYDDDSEYEFYKEINACLSALEQKDFVSLKKERSGKICAVLLKLDSVTQIYNFLNRIPKSNVNQNLLEIFDSYKNLSPEIYLPLLAYIEEQKKRLAENKSVQFFEGKIDDYREILNAATALLENQNEIFIRELSVKLFNDSKKLESIESSVRSLLYNYGDYDDKDTVFEEHGVIKTPTYVMVKGQGILNFAGQTIDLSKMQGDIAFSTQTLKSLSSVELKNASVITVENLTNFHKYQANNELVIYLGGFHNSVKRDFIKLVAKCNPASAFKHFGDIDAGGFYILRHLREKTGINFEPFNMDCKALEKFKNHWIPLTQNDKKRLSLLKDDSPDFSATIDFMLKNNCKLEQESEILL
ncbi:MAG: DUF2220 domain-containing protein [Treponema sp.]|nr:DUF2220 domain-containing protein [Treponema sp.]